MFALPIKKPQQVAAPIRGVLQRKCACGARTPAGGTCASCADKERGLQRKLAIGSSSDPLEQEADRVADQVLADRSPSYFVGAPIKVQRYVPNQAQQAQEAPASVDRTLAMPGRPLDVPLRRDMEQRFGHDFSQVRVHDGSEAGLSARDVGASAYTVGGNIVFGPGRYASESGSGRRLLAHELAHVVQQNFALPRPRAVAAGAASDEYEARSTASGITSGSAAPLVPSSTVLPLQRQPDPENSAENDAVSPDIANDTESPESICGPDITKEVGAACAATKSRFDGWSKDQKIDNCDVLISVWTGERAWDIIYLHDRTWIHDKYTPTCASEYAIPSCWSSVQIDKSCHYAGSVNYVIFGRMFSLCHGFLESIKSSDASDFTAAEMLGLIWEYKGGYHWWRDKAANFEPSNNWAYAGFNGWPSATTPAGDRPNCSPTCPLEYSDGEMQVRWGDDMSLRGGDRRWWRDETK